MKPVIVTEEGQDPTFGDGGEDPVGLDRPAGVEHRQTQRREASRRLVQWTAAAWDLKEDRRLVGDRRKALVDRRSPVLSHDERGIGRVRYRRLSAATGPFVWGPAILLVTAVIVVQVIRRSEGPEPTPPVVTTSTSQPPTEASLAPAPAREQATSEPQAVGPTARFTVGLASYLDLATATTRVEALAARTSDHLFILAPVEIGGRVFHRLLAGLAPDSAAASRLSDGLSQALGEPSAFWIVREAPLAFEVARSPVLDVATERRDEVRILGLPAYVLGVEMSSGPVEYRVYVGAYADDDESSHLRSMLNDNGLADVALVRRVGHPPHTSSAPRGDAADVLAMEGREG